MLHVADLVEEKTGTMSSCISYTVIE